MKQYKTPKLAIFSLDFRDVITGSAGWSGGDGSTGNGDAPETPGEGMLGNENLFGQQ